MEASGDSGRSAEASGDSGRSGAHQGGADETDAHRGGADETGALRGGADETSALRGGAETHGRDWDLEETEAQETERAHIVSRIEAGSLGGHGRSRASGSQDESGDSMGHGGFGASVSNGGKLPPRKSLGSSTTSRGHSGGANVKGHSGCAGSRER